MDWFSNNAKIFKLKNGSKLDKSISMISLWVGIVALMVALIQSRESSKQTKHLQEQYASLTLIKESLSTRYLGQFPEYLFHLAKLIDSAKSDIHIIKGNPIPAYFSAPSIWMNYHHALERKSLEGIQINIICMDARQRDIRLIQQFPNSQQEWENWISPKSKNLDLLNHFLKYNFPEIKLEELTSKFYFSIITYSS